MKSQSPLHFLFYPTTYFAIFQFFEFLPKKLILIYTAYFSIFYLLLKILKKQKFNLHILLLKSFQVLKFTFFIYTPYCFYLPYFETYIKSKVFYPTAYFFYLRYLEKILLYFFFYPTAWYILSSSL